MGGLPFRSTERANALIEDCVAAWDQDRYPETHFSAVMLFRSREMAGAVIADLGLRVRGKEAGNREKGQFSGFGRLGGRDDIHAAAAIATNLALIFCAP